MRDQLMMDQHTLQLLEFHKVRELLAGYAACSLGKELAQAVEPITDAEKIRAEIALVSEMSDALGSGQAPPFGGLHDSRMLVRRAAIGSMLSAEQLLEVADTLACTGNVYRYRMRLDPGYGRLVEMLTPIEDLGVTAKTITGCIDSRGHVLDMASPELADARRKLADIEERVQEKFACRSVSAIENHEVHCLRTLSAMECIRKPFPLKKVARLCHPR